MESKTLVEIDEMADNPFAIRDRRVRHWIVAKLEEVTTKYSTGTPYEARVYGSGAIEVQCPDGAYRTVGGALLDATRRIAIEVAEDQICHGIDESADYPVEWNWEAFEDKIAFCCFDNEPIYDDVIRVFRAIFRARIKLAKHTTPI